MTKDLVIGDAKRNGLSFHPDQNIINKDFRVDDNYYQDTDAFEYFNFTKGHMAPAADFKKSQKLYNTTFTYANAVPQEGFLNQKHWAELEDYGRDLLKDGKCDSLDVFTGPIYQSREKKFTN